MNDQCTILVNIFMCEYQSHRNTYANQVVSKLERNLHITFELVHIWGKNGKYWKPENGQ